MKHITKKNIIRALFILFLLYWSYRWGFIGAMIMPLPLAIICMFNFKWEQTMKYKVKNIKYDMTDSAGKLSVEEGISLPKSLIVYCDSEDEIADTISDYTDWLVESFEIEEVLEYQVLI